MPFDAELLVEEAPVSQFDESLLVEEPSASAPSQGVRFSDYAVEGLRNIGRQVLGLPGELVRLPETIARAAGQMSIEGLRQVPQIVPQPPSGVPSGVPMVPVDAESLRRAIRSNRFLSQTALGPIAEETIAPELLQSLAGATSPEAIGTLPAFGAGAIPARAALAGFSTQAAGQVPAASRALAEATPEQRNQAIADLILTAGMAAVPGLTLRRPQRVGVRPQFTPETIEKGAPSAIQQESGEILRPVPTLAGKSQPELPVQEVPVGVGGREAQPEVRPPGGAPSVVGEPAAAKPVLLKPVPVGSLVELADLGNGQRWFEITEGTFTPATGTQMKAGQRISETQLREAGYEPPKVEAVAPAAESYSRRGISQADAEEFAAKDTKATGVQHEVVSDPAKPGKWAVRRTEAPATTPTPTPKPAVTPAEAPLTAAQATTIPDFAKGYDPETLFQRPAWVKPGSAFDKALDSLREQRNALIGKDVTGVWESLTAAQRQDLRQRGWIVTDSRKRGQVVLKVSQDAVAARNYFGAQNRKALRESATVPQPELPETPSTAAEPAAAPVEGKRPRARAETPHDIILEIEGQYGKIDPKLIREANPDWKPTGAARRIFRRGGTPADVAATQLSQSGIYRGDPAQVDQLGDAINAAARARKAFREGKTGEAKMIQAGEKQASEFASDVIRGERPKGIGKGEEVAVGELLEGDTFKVGKNEFIVEKIEFDEDGRAISVTVKDGPKYGVQYVDGQEIITIDKNSLKTTEVTFEPEPKPSAKPTGTELTLNKPESVAEQNARMAREAGEAAKKAAREQMAERAARPLTGGTGTLGQGDLLERQDLFAPPAPRSGLVGMGGAIPGEFVPPPGSRIALKNAAIDAARIARGEEPLAAVIPDPWTDVWNRAMSRIDRDPAWQDNLIAELQSNMRSVTPEEHMGLLQRQVDYRNEFYKALRDQAQAYEDGRLSDMADLKARADAWSNKMTEIERLSGRGGTGTAAGRALAIRKAVMKSDFTLASLELQKRADLGGRPLTDGERAALKKIADDYKEKADALEKRLKEFEAREETERMTQSLDQIIREAAAEKRSQPRTARIDPNQGIRTVQTRLRDRIEKFGMEGISGLVQKIARLFVQTGIRERNALIDAVHGVLTGIDPAITRRQTMDAISGYGDFRALTKDQTSVQLRDLKGQMQQVAKLEDMQAGQPPLKTGVERRIPSREESRLIKEVNEAKRQFQVPITDPATQLKSSLDTLKTRIQNRIFDLQDRLKNKDYELVKRREPIRRDAEADRLQRELDKIKMDWSNARFLDQMANWSFRQKAWDKFQNIVGLHRAFLTSFEMSAVLRQGKFYALSHPVRAVQTAARAAKAIRSEAARHQIDMEIRDRPNLRFYERDKLALSEHGKQLSKMEEVYRSRWAAKVPGIAASERAYTTFLNLVRADMYDAMTARFMRSGEIPPEHGRAIARFVNAWTGRGDLPFMERTAGDLANLFFAPRYVASRFQVLSGHPFWKATPEVKRLVATEYGRMLAGAALYYTMISAWLGDDVEIGIDPRSTDFGKIRVGNTRIDPMAGLAQITTFLTRVGAGETTTQEGVTVPLREQLTWSGLSPKYGMRTVGDVTGDFLRQKLHPSAQLIATALTQKDPIGRELGRDITWEDVAWQQAPITYQGMLRTMEEQGIPRGTALMVLAFFGEGVNTYEER